MPARSMGGRPAPRPNRPRVGRHPPALQRSACYQLALMRALLSAIALACCAGRAGAAAPFEAERVGAPDAPVRVLVVGSIHGNETAGHAIVAPARAHPAAGRGAAVARRVGEPGRGRARHAPERPRRRSQPQLPVGLARRRPAVRHVLPGTRTGVGAGDPGAHGARPRGPARPDALLPPAHAARRAAARRRPRAGARVRAARRSAHRAGSRTSTGRRPPGRTTRSAAPPSSSSCRPGRCPRAPSAATPARSTRSRRAVRRGQSPPQRRSRGSTRTRSRSAPTAGARCARTPSATTAWPRRGCSTRR